MNKYKILALAAVICGIAAMPVFSQSINTGLKCIVATGSGGCVGATSPTIGSPTLNGTIGGAPTVSGAWQFTGIPNFNVSASQFIWTGTRSGTQVAGVYVSGSSAFFEGTNGNSAILGSAADAGGSVPAGQEWVVKGASSSLSCATYDLCVAADNVQGIGSATFRLDHVYSVDTIGTTAELSGAETLSGNGAASASILNMTGTPFAGTGTTSTPLLFLNNNASNVISWSTSGTYLGISAPSGFTGSVIDYHLNATNSLFSVNSSGSVTSGGSITAATSVTAGAANSFVISARAKISSPADGVLEALNNAGTGFTRLQLGGTTSSFGALQTNGTETDSELADGSAAAGLGASYLRFYGTAVTLSGTGTPTCASTGTGCTNSSGDVTAGASATSVVVTFAGAFGTGVPTCNVTPHTQLVSFSYTVTATAITITQTATSGDVISYECFAH